jgi:hypothetical protein
MKDRDRGKMEDRDRGKMEDRDRGKNRRECFTYIT